MTVNLGDFDQHQIVFDFGFYSIQRFVSGALFQTAIGTEFRPMAGAGENAVIFAPLYVATLVGTQGGDCYDTFCIVGVANYGYSGSTEGFFRNGAL